MGQIWKEPKGVKSKNGKVWDPTIKASQAKWDAENKSEEEVKAEAKKNKMIIERFE